MLSARVQNGEVPCLELSRITNECYFCHLGVDNAHDHCLKGCFH
jgi:hypothetical protein